jgi:hypothetical protein
MSEKNVMISASGGEVLVEQLAAGEAEPVLVIDFAPFSAAPRLGEQLSAVSGSRQVYQVDPLSALSQDRLYASLPDLAAIYTDAFLSCGPAAGRVFIVGHCSAAPLSLRVMDLLSGSRAVTVILLEPTWPDDQLIRDLFAEFQANLGTQNHPCPGLDGDPADSLARMEEVLRQGMFTVAASRGLDGSVDVFGDLLRRYRAWLAFLLACRNDAPVTFLNEAATVKVLTSARSGIDVPGMEVGACEIVQMPASAQGSPGSAGLVELALAQITGPQAAGR